MSLPLKLHFQVWGSVMNKTLTGLGSRACRAGGALLVRNPQPEGLVLRVLGLSCCPKSESKSDSATQGQPLQEEPPPGLPAWGLGALRRLRKSEYLRMGNR